MTELRRVWKTTALLTALLLGSGGLGCAFGEFRPEDPMNRKFTLEKMSKRYSYLVRWSKFKQAAQFIDPRQRSDFMDWAPDVKKIRFTDYQIGDVEVDEEKRKSTIEVTYMAYSLFALVEYEIHETQEWSREGRGNNWIVKTSFAPLPEEEPDPESVPGDGDGDSPDDASEEAKTAMN